MKIIKKIILSMLCTCILAGCSQNDVYPYTFLEDIEKNYDYVYDVTNKNIVSYDSETNALSMYNNSDTSEYQSVFFYMDKFCGNLLSVGDSVDGDFAILDFKKNKFNVCYNEKNKNISYFPMAQTNENYYFSVENEEDEKRTGGLAVWNQEDGMKMDSRVPKDIIIQGAVVVEDKLFFSTYADDETYKLFSLDLKNEKAKPKMITDKLSEPELYMYHKKVCYYVNDVMKIGKVKLTYHDDVYEYKDKIIEFYENGEGIECCRVYDLETGKVLKKIEQAIGLSLQQELSIYSVNGREMTIK